MHVRWILNQLCKVTITRIALFPWIRFSFQKSLLSPTEQLLEAIRADDAKEVEVLIRRFQWSAKNLNDMVTSHPLHDFIPCSLNDFAVVHNKPSALKVLLMAGFVPDHNPLSSLFLACRLGRLECVEVLLPHMEDVNRPLCWDAQNTVLHYVCRAYSHHQVEIVCRLLDAGAAVNARNKKDETPLHALFDKPMSVSVDYPEDILVQKEKIFLLLLKKDADIAACNLLGQTPLSMVEDKQHFLSLVVYNEHHELTMVAHSEEQKRQEVQIRSSRKRL